MGDNGYSDLQIKIEKQDEHFFRLSEYDLTPIKKSLEAFGNKVNEYFYPNGRPKKVDWTDESDYVRIVGSIVDELETYNQADHAMNVVRFEVNYDHTPEEYAERKKKIISPYLIKEWENLAAKSDYYRVYGAIPFVEKLEGILKEIAKISKNSKFEVPDLLKIITSKKYLNDFDKDNYRLYEEYQDAIDKDKKAFGESLDIYYDQVRDTDIYSKRDKPSDKEFVGYTTSFSELFNSITKAVVDNTFVDYDDNSKDNNNYHQFLDRIEELPNTYKKYDQERVSLLFQESKYPLTQQEINQLHVINKEMFKNLEIIRRVIVKSNSKDKKYINILKAYYYNLVKLEVINYIIEVLEKNNTNPFNSKYSVFKNTLEFLSNAKKECTKYIEKHEKTLSLFNNFYGKADTAVYTLNQLILSYNNILDIVKQRLKNESGNKEK